MSHYSEDQLLEYALEILDDSTRRADIEAHLRLCPGCRAKLEDIEKVNDALGNVKPYRQLLLLPNPRTRRLGVLSAVKVAALIIAGFFAGFGAANWAEKQPAEAAYAYLVLTPPEDTGTGGAVSDATEVTPRYYRETLQSQK
jgi:hypothetical protein